MAYGSVHFTPGEPGDGTGSGGASNADVLKALELAGSAAETAAAAQNKVAELANTAAQLQQKINENESSLTELSATVSSLSGVASQASKDAEAAKEAAKEATDQTTAAVNAASDATKAATEAVGKVTAIEETLDSIEPKVALLDTKPEQLEYGHMAMVGSQMYIGGPNKQVLTVVLTGDSVTITISTNEIKYVDGKVYYGDPVSGMIKELFTDEDDVITQAETVPETLGAGEVVAVGTSIFIGNADSSVSEVTKAEAPTKKPTEGKDHTLTIWGGRIYLYGVDKKWYVVGHCVGIGSGTLDSPDLGIPDTGDAYTFAMRDWLIVGIDSEWISLLMYNVSTETAFGDTIDYAASTIKPILDDYAALFNDEDKAVMRDLTFGDTTAKVVIPTVETLQSFDYLKDPENLVATVADSGTAQVWWTSTPSDTDPTGSLKCISAEGAPVDQKTTSKAYLRPFIAIKYSYVFG